MMKRSQNTSDHVEGARVRNRLQPRNRVTERNGDTSLFVAPSSKRLGPVSSRMSVMPINQSEVTKKIELETNNELSTLYHKYLQTKMELLIQKHKSQDREKDVHIGVASLARENENSEEKLDEIQMRKIEMNGLNEIQKILDKQITEIKKSLETFDKKKGTILEEISLLIRDLDYLTCKNLKVPQVDEELKLFQSALIKTVDIIAVLNRMIGTNSSTMISGGKGLKTFVDTHDKLEKQLKPVECNLRKLQVEILRKTSVDLANHQLN